MFIYTYKGRDKEKVPEETNVVKFASSIRIIRFGVFSKCESIILIAFEVIEDEAFCSCRSLEKVFMLSSVKIIEFGAFSKCSSLTNMDLYKANEDEVEGKVLTGYMMKC